MSHTHEADIAIIGAGIAGAGFAAALSGGAGAVLLEQEARPGHHSTGRSAAVFIQNYGNDTIRALNRASRPRFLAPEEPDLFPAPLLTQRDVVFVTDEEGRGHLDALLAELTDLREIDPDEMVRRVPILRRDWMVAAAIETDASDIDVDALHQGWLRKARHAGTALWTDAPVLSARRENGAWLIETPKGRLRARVIVNAAGAWADVVADACGVARVGLQPMRRSVAVLPVPEDMEPASWPLVADAAERWYMKPEAGRLLVSPADEDPVEPHDAFVDDMVLAEGLYRYEQATTHPVTRVESSWAGLRTFASDRTPVVGFDPAAEGFFWLAGQGGYGIQTSPAMSALAAALVEERSVPDGLDPILPALSPARFR